MYVVYDNAKCTQGSYGKYTENDGLICDFLLVWHYPQGHPYPNLGEYSNVGVLFDADYMGNIILGGCLTLLVVADPPASYEVVGYWDC